MTKIVECGVVTYVERTCPFCGTRSTVSVPTTGFRAWQDGELIQNTMPDLNATAREFLISGMCRDCQDSMFDDGEF